MIRFRCRACGGAIAAAGNRVGAGVPCPTCGAIMAVPEPLLGRPWFWCVVAGLCLAVVAAVLIYMHYENQAVAERSQQIIEESRKWSR